MRIRILGLQKCGCNEDPDPKPIAINILTGRLTFEDRSLRIRICADNGLDNEGQARTTPRRTQSALTHGQEPNGAAKHTNKRRRRKIKSRLFPLSRETIKKIDFKL